MVFRRAERDMNAIVCSLCEERGNDGFCCRDGDCYMSVLEVTTIFS